MQWTYGITTVPSRMNSTLPLTIESLAKAGFDKPRLFVDGCIDPTEYRMKFGLPVTARYPNIGVAANWLLSLLELYTRNPECERFAIFQDDITICLNVKKYLEQYEYGYHNRPYYWNLYTFPQNEDREDGFAPIGSGNSPPKSLKPNPDYRGFYPSNQRGRGATALVFDRTAITKLVGNENFIRGFQDVKRASIDGRVMEIMRQVGYTELVHSPSLTQHIGDLSTLNHPQYPKAFSFPGETFDAMNLVPCSVTSLNPS